jgi:hypothetical protein
MASNTTVLLIVTAMAALVLAGVLAGVVYKTRGPNLVETVRDEAEQDALALRHQEVLADELDARAHRSEAVTSRDQLNELRR